MSLITKPKTYIDNDPIVYSDLNANWDALYNLVNGNLDNSNISSSAAIDPLKISGGAVTLTGAQTVSGQKTLIKPIVNVVQNVTNDTFATNMTLDMSQSNYHSITLAGGTTLAISNISVGQAFVVRLAQDATGSRTIVWFATIKWPNGTVPTLSTAANAVDSFGFICTATGQYDGFIIGQALA